jgi:hypothetical protein
LPTRITLLTPLATFNLSRYVTALPCALDVLAWPFTAPLRREIGSLTSAAYGASTRLSHNEKSLLILFEFKTKNQVYRPGLLTWSITHIQEKIKRALRTGYS